MSQILLHVGFPKAGSSFLGQWFHQNPNFIFKDFAICGFNNTQELMNMAIKHKDFDSKVFVLRDMKFSSPQSNDFTEINNIEDFQKKTAKTLHTLFPKAKILIVTRGFESALKASYSQYIKEGGLLKYNKLIENNKETKWFPYNYTYLIKIYVNLFGSENILILPFELLKNNSTLFIKNIETFLNIQYFSFCPTINNQSLTPQQITFMRKINNVVYLTFFLLGPFHKITYKLYLKILDKHKTNNWNNFIFKLFSKLFKPEKFNFIFTKEIKDKFKEHGHLLNNYYEYKNLKKEYHIAEI